MTDEAKEVIELSNMISPLFAGRKPEVVGAVLADLLATLLASHVGPQQDQAREEILTLHLACVRGLVTSLDRMRRKSIY